MAVKVQENVLPGYAVDCIAIYIINILFVYYRRYCKLCVAIFYVIRVAFCQVVYNKTGVTLFWIKRKV